MLEKLERLERPDDSWEHAGKIGLSFQTGGDLGSKETIRAPKLTVGYPGAAILHGRHRQRLPRRQARHRGAERRRQVDAAEDAASASCAAAGEGRVRQRRAHRLLRSEAGHAGRVADADRRDPIGARRSLARSRSGSTWPSFVSSATTRSAWCGASRAASAAGWRWRRSCCSRATCWCSTSRPTTSTSPRARRWKTRSSAYEGTLITVSHDRYFLDRICTRLLVIEGTHVEVPHVGNYSDWQGAAQKESAPAARPQPAAPPPSSQPPEKPAANRAKAGGAHPRDGDKQREREQRRLARRVETLEADVSKLEAELAGRPRRSGRRSRRRLAKAARPGRARARARRPARPPDRRMGSGQRGRAQPGRRILPIDHLETNGRSAGFRTCSQTLVSPPQHCIALLGSYFDRVNCGVSLREVSGCGSLVC